MSCSPNPVHSGVRERPDVKTQVRKGGVEGPVQSGVGGVSVKGAPKKVVHLTLSPVQESKKTH